MGAGRTASATSGQDGPAASLALASHHRRRSLRSARGLRLASPARWAVRCAALRVPPWRTVYWWFRRLLANGTWDRLSAALVMADRERVGRAPQPTGCVLDSQTAKAGGTGVAGPRGGACPWAGKAGPEGPGQASRRAQTHGAGQHGWTFAPCGGRARRPAQHATRGSGAARLAAALALSRPVLDGCGLCWAARCPCHARADRGGGRSITHTRLDGPGTAMGDQAHLRHVRAQPPPRARSRGAARRGRRLDHPRLRRPDAQAARSSLSFQNGSQWARDGPRARARRPPAMADLSSSRTSCE